MASKIDSSAPLWVTAPCWLVIGGFGFWGAVLADTRWRGQSNAWLGVAALIIAGIIVAAVLYVFLMRAVIWSRKAKAAEQDKREAELRADYERVRAETIASAREAFPQCVDEYALLNAPCWWPPKLFERLFKVPDAIVSFQSAGGHSGEVRMWSKELVGKNSRDSEYVKHLERVEENQRAYEAELLQEDEERKIAEAAERKEAEARRIEADALATRMAQQVVVSAEDLKRRRT